MICLNFVCLSEKFSLEIMDLFLLLTGIEKNINSICTCLMFVYVHFLICEFLMCITLSQHRRGDFSIFPIDPIKIMLDSI